MTSIMVLMVITMLGIAFISLTITNLVRAHKDETRTVAFHLAEAGVEHAIAQIIDAAESNGGYIVASTYDSTAILDELVAGTSGSVSIVPDAGNDKMATVNSSATYRNITESVRVRVTTGAVGVWDNAIFAGVGQSGRGIAGNVDIRGSVHILGEGDPFSDLNGNGVRDVAEVFNDANGNGIFEPHRGETFTDTDGNGVWTPAEPYQDSNMNGVYDDPLTAHELATDMTGTAKIGNNYNGMPSALRAKVPALVPKVFGGQLVETLNAELRVKHGKVNLSGNANAGEPNNTGNTLKETLNGVYVSDGYGGNKGASSVHSDNGTANKYDMGDRVPFPSLFDSYTNPTTGATYSTYANYLRSRAMVVSITKLDGTVPSFAMSDGSNSISWNASTKVLSINGIVRINGDLDLARKNEAIAYQGRGTFFVEGTIRVHSTVLPVNTFPTVDALGCIAGQDIEFATGSGEAQLSGAGAWYAQRKIKSAKQNQFAGTYVANYFDMGTNVPNIYQVPSLSRNLPPGMPGGDACFASVQVVSWKRL